MRGIYLPRELIEDPAINIDAVVLSILDGQVETQGCPECGGIMQRLGNVFKKGERFTDWYGPDGPEIDYDAEVWRIGYECNECGHDDTLRVLVKFPLEGVA